jgi:hypothetical protein
MNLNTKQWQWQQQHEQMDKKICTFFPECSLWLHTTWEYIVLLLACGVLCAAYYQRDRAAILSLVTSWVSMRPCNDNMESFQSSGALWAALQ